MPPIVQFLVVLAAAFLGYYLLFKGFRLPSFFSKTRPCPNCDGKGHWYGVRHREECKVCEGTGRLPK